MKTIIVTRKISFYYIVIFAFFFNFLFFAVADAQWHTFETYIKMNSVGNYDGAVTVWVDGNKKLEVVNMRTAHDTNIRDYGDMGIPEYSYECSPEPCTTDTDWDIYYDDVIVSDTYNGVPDVSTDTMPPASPSGLAVS